MTKLRAAFVTIAAGAALTAIPAKSDAAVTIGSNLGRASDASLVCGLRCTIVQASLAADRQAPGGILSPVNGTVTGWRIRSGLTAAPTELRVIRLLGPSLFTGAGTSATVTPPINSISEFPTQLPISIGDRVGLNCCGSQSHYFVQTGGFAHSFQPPLADGGPGEIPAPILNNTWEMLVNADIEPTSTFQVLSKTKRNGGKLKVRVSLPNPGELVADGKRFNETARTASGPGELTFKLTPTKRTRNLLEDRNKVKAKALIEFTPTFGTAPGEQRVKAKIQG